MDVFTIVGQLSTPFRIPSPSISGSFASLRPSPSVSEPLSVDPFPSTSASEPLEIPSPSQSPFCHERPAVLALKPIHGFVGLIS